MAIRPAASLHLRLAACASAATLMAALIAQFGFNLPPCHLCLLQRWPYIIIIVIGVLGGWFIKNITYLRALELLVIASLLVGFGIAFYHTGVQWEWFPGPSSCSSGGDVGETLEEMRRAIMEAPVLSCDQPIGEIVGLSLAAWSALIYAFLTIMALIGYNRSHRLDFKA
jgi:disulfide bond formation protein DsbB